MTPMSNIVFPVKLTPQGTRWGNHFLPLTPLQASIEQTWEGFLNKTLGPEMVPEELEAIERALKKFKGVTSQKLENPYFWESWAPTWAEYTRRNLNRELLLLNRLGCFDSCPRLISLGAGSCWQEVFLAQYCCYTSQVFAVDFSSHMISRGIVLARDRNISNIHFLLGKVEHLPFAKKTGDLVISLNVMDVLPDIPRVLGEIKRILADPPKGRYFFLFPLNPRDRLRQTAEAWRSMVLDAGLDNPSLFCMSGKNYKGQSLRLLGLTNINPLNKLI
jgi:SAM-dependent methyltransferase